MMLMVVAGYIENEVIVDLITAKFDDDDQKDRCMRVISLFPDELNDGGKADVASSASLFINCSSIPSQTFSSGKSVFAAQIQNK